MTQEAITAATVLKAEPILAGANELLRTARGGDLPHEPWRPLSVREFEVASAIASGMTNAQIAGQLFVSPKTVSAHVEHILAKLGVARRAEIAAWVATIRPAGATGSVHGPGASTPR